MEDKLIATLQILETIVEKGRFESESQKSDILDDINEVKGDIERSISDLDIRNQVNCQRLIPSLRKT